MTLADLPPEIIVHILTLVGHVSFFDAKGRLGAPDVQRAWDGGSATSDALRELARISRVCTTWAAYAAVARTRLALA